jgi:hypothetical protein
MNKRISIIAVTSFGFIALALIVVGCNSDISRSSSPVELLIHTISQPIQKFDIAASTSTACQQNVSNVEIENRIKNPATSNTTFLDVHLTRYRVTWARTDGGKQVPAPVDQAMDLLVAAGGTSDTAVFHLGQLNIFDQAPFAALLPQNGGKDPDTGSNVLHFNVTTTIFGQTLAGDNVSASSTIPLQVCFNCGDCTP